MPLQGFKQLKRNSRRGLSLPFVACAGAFLLAFALALVYTAGVMLSNANHKLAEERCYQLAKSFAGVVGRELEKQDSDFCEFANKFLNNPAYNRYNPEHPETVYHYILQAEEEEKYGKTELRLRKEINEEDLAGLEGTIERPPQEGSDLNYTGKIEELRSRKFQCFLLTVEVISGQGDITYNYDTEYYREDVYPLVFRYKNQKIVWDDNDKSWKYGDMAGNECEFEDPNADITYTYDTGNPVSARFVPVHKERGAF